MRMTIIHVTNTILQFRSCNDSTKNC